MKIAINTLSENPYAPSGAQGYYINLLRELSEIGQDHQFYLFVSKANQHLFGPYAHDNMHKILFKHSNEHQKRRIFTEHFGFSSVIKKYDIDVLNTGVAVLQCPCKLVVTMKTMHAYTNPKELPLKTLLYRRLVYNWTVRKADIIISNSRSHSQDLIKYLPVDKKKIALVYEALDHDLFKPVSDKSIYYDQLSKMGVTRPFILFVSSLWPYKNAETLIEAFAQLKGKLEQYQLIIAGFSRDDAYLGDLKKRIKEHQLEQRIVFTGGLPHETLAILYKTARLFVYPSLYETFGLTILEAMACGCPVITSNISSMPEIAGGAALLFDPKNVEDLTRQMITILGDDSAYQSRVNAGLKRATEFTWGKTAINTLYAFLSASGKHIGTQSIEDTLTNSRAVHHCRVAQNN